jgi:hypothetical protein
VTTVWADERVYHLVHAMPCTPARHFAKVIVSGTLITREHTSDVAHTQGPEGGSQFPENVKRGTC